MTRSSQSPNRASQSPGRLSQSPASRRQFRNWLIEPRFQLKYTGIVIVLTVIVMSVLGGLAWRMAREASESFEFTLNANPPSDPAVEAQMREMVRVDDDIALYLAVGGGVLTFLLGMWGIVITHRVVGPAHKMRRLLRRVAEGHLSVDGQLRKGDELQELFRQFEAMVRALRDAQAEEVALLDSAIAKAKTSGVPDEALAEIVEVRNRMQAELE